jgi:hypothetical protein
MDPYYRFFILKNPLFKIAWNSLLACDAHERSADTLPMPVRIRIARQQVERVKEVEKTPLFNKDVIPFYCYMADTLAENGIFPLGNQFSLRWYRIDRVEWYWNLDYNKSYAVLRDVGNHIQEKFHVTLKPPPG